MRDSAVLERLEAANLGRWSSTVTILLDRDGSLTDCEAPPGLDEVGPDRSVTDPTRAFPRPYTATPVIGS